MYVVLALDDGSLDWKDFQRDGPTVIQRISLTEYAVPKDALFNLLNDETSKEEKDKLKTKSASIQKPKTHIKTKVFVTILTDKASMSPQDVAPELARLTRVSRKNEFVSLSSVCAKFD